MIKKIHLEEFELYNTDQKTRNLSLKINELVDVVNQLTSCEQARTCHELIHKNEEPADLYAEQRKWIGKLCRFRDNDDDKWNYSTLKSIININCSFPFKDAEDYEWAICEPVKPSDDVIFKESAPTDNDLRNMMKDPKYWRDKDPETVRRVEEGFKKLYGNKGEVR